MPEWALATDIELFENLPLDYASLQQARASLDSRRLADRAVDFLARARAGRPSRAQSAVDRSTAGASSTTCGAAWFRSHRSLLLLFGWLASRGAGRLEPGGGPGRGRFPRWPPAGSLARARFKERFSAGRARKRSGARRSCMIAFLPHQAWISADAIARVFYRRFVSRRHLLEWQTAEEAGAAHRHIQSHVSRMWIISGLSAVPARCCNAAGQVWRPTFVFLGLWIARSGTDAVAGAPGSARYVLDNGQRHNYLRLLARRTWRYFDDLVGPDPTGCRRTIRNWRCASKWRSELRPPTSAYGSRPRWRPRISAI